MPNRRFQRVDFAQRSNDDTVARKLSNPRVNQNETCTREKQQKLEVTSSGSMVGIDATGYGLPASRSAPEPSLFLDEIDTCEIRLPRPSTNSKNFARSVISSGGDFKNLIARRRGSPSQTKTNNVPLVPLEHERALTAIPAANSQSLHRRRSQPGACAPPETNGIVNSVFAGSKKDVLVLNDSERLEVEAVYVNMNSAQPSKESIYVQRLLQDKDEPNEGVSSGLRSTQCERNETTRDENPTSQCEVTGEISNLDSFDELGQGDRYSIRKCNARASSDPVLLSRFSTFSTSNGMDQDDSDSEESSMFSNPSIATATSLKRGSRIEDLMRRSSISKRKTSTTHSQANYLRQLSFATGASSTTSESVAAPASDSTLRRPCVSGDFLSLNRDRTNTSVASMLSQDSTHYGKRYPSFGSAYGSVSKPEFEQSNIPISQDFKDMADEITRNPRIVMQWLNPM